METFKTGRYWKIILVYRKEIFKALKAYLKTQEFITLVIFFQKRLQIRVKII